MQANFDQNAFPAVLCKVDAKQIKWLEFIPQSELYERCDERPTVSHIIIIINKDWQCKAGRGRLTPYQSEDPSPTLPTYRGKEEKGKTVDKNGESN